MRIPRPVSAFLLALAVLSLPGAARAAYPLVSTASVSGAVSGSIVNRLVQNPATGDLYAAGSLAAGAGNLNIWVGRYSSSLVLLSTYTLDKAGFDDAAYGVAVDTATGDVYATGYVSSTGALSGRDVWLARFSSALVLQSSITVNGSVSDRDEGTNVLVSSNAVFVVGISSQTGGKGVWLANYDASLVLLSSANYYQNNVEVSDFLRTAGGVYVAGGRAPNFFVSNDAWIGKFTANHVFIASSAYDGPASQTDHLFGVAEDGSGGVFAVGYVYSGTLGDQYIARFDSNLVRVASTTINGPGNGNESLSSVVRAASGNLLVAGSYSTVAGLGGINAYIAEYDSSLNKISSTAFTSSGNASDWVGSLLIGANQDIYAAGYAANGGSQDMWLGRFSTATAGADYPGCAVTNNVGAGQTYATITAALAALPPSLTGHNCVVIRDGATYAEQVTVRNFTNNGSSITIMADPGSGLTPVVAPPGGATAAFLIANASVNVTGIHITPANTAPYGIFVSSSYVKISSVNVQDGTGKISIAAVVASSWTTISYTSVTVGGSNAAAFWLPGSTKTSVTDSWAVASGSAAYGIRLTNANSNTFADDFVQNLPGIGVQWVGSSYNTITRSSIACDNGTGTNAALYLSNSSSNTITTTYVKNSFVNAIGFNSDSNYNTVSQTTATLTGAGGQSAIGISASHYNTVTGCMLTASGGVGINLGNSNFNAISQTTMSITNGMGIHALRFNVASSNTVSQCHIHNPGDTAVAYQNGSAYNTISQSVIVGAYSTNLYPAGVYLQNGSYNTITLSHISNPTAYGAIFGAFGSRNTISLSTITSGDSGHSALYFMSGSGTNTVTGSYIQGASTAAYLTGSISPAVSSSVIVGGALGAAVYLDRNNTGTIVVSSNTVSGGKYGLLITTQATGAALLPTTLNFAGLAAGATAINFTGGTVTATFTAAGFDAGVAVNVNAAPLNAASRVTMSAFGGARGGAAFESDPSSLVDWVSGTAPAAPTDFIGTAQSTSTIQWTWTDASSDEIGFRLLAGATNVSGDLDAGTTLWLQTGLGVNGNSGALVVQAFNGSGTANSAIVTRYSLADVPTGLAASGVTASSATISWAGAGTSYQLEVSTGSAFTTISTGASTSFGSTGLAPASTYYYRVLAYNGDSIATAYASSITVVTLPSASSPAPPSSFAGAAQTTNSILWTWTDNATTETGFRLLAGTTNVSGDLAANTTSWLQSGLGVNASSGPLIIEVFNSTGTNSAGPLTVYSLAAAPTGLASSGVFQTSATVSWSAAGNPANTIFALERSTGGGFSALVSSTAVSYADASLTGAATYHYRVRALNTDAIATAYSSSITIVTAPTPAPGAPSAFTGAAQSESSILWTWTDNASNEDGFRVMSGTIAVSGNLAANATFWLQSGLGGNALTGPYAAQAYNAGGAVDSSTASRTTLAAVPVGLTASGVYQTSATVSWSQGTNAAGTTFQLERSTGTGYGQLLSGAATYYFDANLSPSATHYYRVRAINAEAVATAYASSISVVALPPPAVPGAAGTPAGTVLGVSSISWTWALASGATNHFLYRASDGVVLATQPSGPFVQTGLAGNTAYGLRVAGVNLGGLGPLSAAATAYTWAAVPSGAAAVSIASTSLTASWGLNGNDASTVAQLQRSTNAVDYSTLTIAAVTSYADADLLGCSTYYYRVRNENAAGVLSAYASFTGVTANTVAAPPAGLTASANAGGSVSLAWNLSGTEGVTGYRLYWDSGTGTVSYAAPLAVLGSTATAYTTGVLTSSASYTFALRTAHRCGLTDTTGALAMSGAAVAPPAVRAAIKEPDSGRRVSGNSLTILAELTAGTPSDVQQIVFQYKTAVSTAWVNINAVYLDHPNPDFSFPYFTHVDVTGWAAGSYDLRSVAYDRDGVPDSAPSAVRVVVDHTSPDIREGLTINGEIKKDQVVSNAVTSVVETAGDNAADPAVRVTIPAGSVNSATATVSVIANPVITTAAPTGQSFVGSAIKINLSNGQTALNGTAAISLTYPDTVRFPALLQIFYLDEATGQWSRDFTSTVNTTSRTVSGNTPHFSTFALLLGTAFAANLDSVQVYPVPFKPNGRNPDEGRPFTTGDAGSGILFSNLAQGSTIKIYTLTGRLVSSLDNAPITGTVRWDAKNQDGRDVASGAYFAVITATGQKSVVKKLVIIR